MRALETHSGLPAMHQLLTAVAALLLSVLLLMLSGGLLGSLVGLRAIHEGFPITVAGMMMSAFYAGLILGTLRCGRLINRVGHIRAFSAFCALNATAILALPLVVDPWAWLALRALIGFNMAGLYMAIESWLNASTGAETRGTIMAIYMALSYLAMGGGQFMLGLTAIEENTLFIVAAMLMTLAVVPVAMTRASHPTPVETSRLNLLALYRLSPLAVLGCACGGMLTGSLFGIGPIYAGQLGLELPEIARFMGVLIISGLVLQLPLGRISDRVDRRLVIAVTAAVAALASLLLWPLTDHYTVTTLSTGGAEARFLWLPDPLPLLLASAICGGTMATIYPLSVAHANDYISAEDMVQASGGLVLAYGSGAICGPAGAALAMHLVGPGGLFGFTAIVAALTVALALWRHHSGASAEEADKEAFVVMPVAVTLPNVAELDPRVPDPEEETPGIEIEAVETREDGDGTLRPL
jgi:MFS family permease